jgi:pentatricopeptide repeat protein
MGVSKEAAVQGRPAKGGQNSASRYTPIEDYGAVGNMRSVALVSRRGSIDWCCFPRLDAGSVFAAILDHRRGGRFRVAPASAARGADEAHGDQHYVKRTNVLVTRWDGGGARLSVTDFMPLDGRVPDDGEPPPAVLYRVLRCEGGSLDVALEWSPRFDYARASMTIEAGEGGYHAAAGDERLVLEGLPVHGRVEEDDDGQPVLRATFTLSDGDVVPLLCRYVEDGARVRLEEWEERQHRTEHAWRQWLETRDEGQPCDFAGQWQPLVNRSGLAAKLVTYPKTGAIAAAATTSLPEEIGGVRNWDYRYAWIRDASFTAQAFVALGHRREAVQFLEWAENVSMQGGTEREKLHLMYSLYGETDLEEKELDHLEGYRESRPVRIGNKAAEQFQLDIYGELLSAAYELARLGVRIDELQWKFLTFVADQACSRWQEPDYGIWEVRAGKQHFVHSKLMAWVALDRAIRLADRFGLPGDVPRWRRTCDAVRASILEHGYDEERGAFVQYYGSQALDASNLVMSVVGFLPPDDPRIQSTIDRSLEELTENGLVFRYRPDQTDDGLPGHEGAFGLTTFWMIDALALSGRIDEARSMFDGMARRANHVGLYSEEIDPESGLFLGNFPQAFTHIGFVNSAVYIAHAEGRDIPAPAPLGSPSERHGDNGESGGSAGGGD